MAEQLFERIASELQVGVETRLHLGGQIYVSIDGEPALDDAFGEVRPGEPMTTRHMPIWFSSGKPIAAVAIGQLWEQNKLGLDDPVSAHIPEFAAGGKEVVTVRHLLTHTGGFRMLDTGWPEQSWDEVIRAICAKRLEPRWRPGVTAGYHRTSSWFILGELIRRIDGRRFDEYARDEIMIPLGMADSWVGMPVDRFLRYRDRIAPLFDTEGPEVEETKWAEQAWVTPCSPGANARGPARELGKFYEAMIEKSSQPDGQVLLPQTIEALTATHRVGRFDKTFQAVIDWGLGFVKNSPQVGEQTRTYSFGHHVSSRAFGHSGYRSSIGFADPEFDLALALIVNGTAAEEDYLAYVRTVVDSIYEDLGLVSD